MKIKASNLAELSFVLYFANTFFQTLVYDVLHLGSMMVNLVMLFPYAFLIAAMLLNPSRYIKLDVFVLYFLVASFFVITLLAHPNYGYFYSRAEYGVWPHVFKPYRGIYAYMFIRLLDNPQSINKAMKKAGWLMMIYGAISIHIATSRGYWMGVGAEGAVKMSYSVSFGYRILPFALFFINDALKDRKLLDIWASIVFVLMILSGGSRGTVLCIGIYMILYISSKIKKSTKSVFIIITTMSITGILYLTYDYILVVIRGLLSKFGISSRFINSLLAGNIADDNNRNEIWNAALGMIKRNPFGYGAMGSRHVITDYIIAGYPHSIFLEFLIDYGVFLGGGLLIFFGIYSFLILFRTLSEEWKHVFLPFLGSAGCLLISMTYWSVPAYWACLAIGYSYYNYFKKRRKKQP